MKKLFTITLFSTAFTFAQTGSLDISFDTDGKVTTAIGTGSNVIYDIVLQADGKIVAVGNANNGTNEDIALARYNIDGSLDPTFDTDGIVITDLGLGDDIGYGIALQPDGKIVVAGESSNGTNSDFVIVRYHTDGSLDNTFDGDGYTRTDFDNFNDKARDVAIQSDGKIVAGGSAYIDTVYNYAAARYNTNGSLDNTFDTDGKVNTLVTYNDQGNAIAIQSDGKILLGGVTLQLDFYNAFGIVRYNTNGSLDNTFDGDGKVITTSISTFGEEIKALTLQPDGKIVVAGNATPTGPIRFAVARYNTDGSLDNSFNTTGFVVSNFGSVWDEARSVLVQPDGKILVGGLATSGSQRFGMMLFNPDGSLYTSFGSSGKLMTTVGTSASIWSLAYTTDDKIVAGGTANTDGFFDFALARYGGSGTKGINDITNGSLDIYPNPFVDQIKVGFELNSGEEVTIQMLDMEGKVVQQFVHGQPLSPGHHEFIFQLNETLATGSYLLRISSSTGMATSKLIKK